MRCVRRLPLERWWWCGAMRSPRLGVRRRRPAGVWKALCPILGFLWSRRPLSVRRRRPTGRVQARSASIFVSRVHSPSAPDPSHRNSSGRTSRARSLPFGAATVLPIFVYNAVGVRATPVDPDVQVTYSKFFTDGVDGVTGLGQASSVALSHDGLNVYTTGITNNRVAVFARDLTDGTLVWVETFENGQGGVEMLTQPCAVTVSPDGKNVYVGGCGDMRGDSGALGVFDRSTTDGTLTWSTFFKSGVEGVEDLRSPNGIVVSPDGQNVYVAARGSNSLVVFDRSTADGSLMYSAAFSFGRSRGVIEGLSGCLDVAVSPDGEGVYVIGRGPGVGGWSGPSSVSVFDRSTSDGSLTWSTYYPNGLNGVEGMDDAESLTLSPDGKNVYVGAKSSLVVFDRSTSDRSLTYSTHFEGGSDTLFGVRSVSGVAASADGLSVYVASKFDRAMAVFDRRTSDGSLTYLTSFKNGEGGVDGLKWASDVVVSPEGSTVLVTADGDNSLVVFSRSGGSAPMPVPVPSPSSKSLSPPPPPLLPEAADIINLNAALLAAGSDLQVTAEDVAALDVSSAEIYCAMSTDVATDLDKARTDVGLSSVCNDSGKGGVEDWVVGVSVALALVACLLGFGLILHRRQQRSARTMGTGMASVDQKRPSDSVSFNDNPLVAFGNL